MKDASVAVINGRIGRSLVAVRPIQINETILSFQRNFVDISTNKTLRIDAYTHQLSSDTEAPENFVNHSCAANAYIDFSDISLKALRGILAGEEVTYNYFTSDWDDEDVFECACGASECKKHIAGFKSLKLEDRLALKNRISPFLRSKLYDDLMR